MRIVEQYFEKLKTEKRKLRRSVVVLTSLSFLVVGAVSWSLRLTGVTIANGATCKKEEHTHTETCFASADSCGVEEHIHVLACYSDTSADVETAKQWEATLPELTGVSSDDMIQIALSQIGNGESESNFEIAEDGETKRGITRYGQWYGNPYGEWANMFTSFCLWYAGLTEVPLHAGAETMRVAWQDENIYRPKENYDPLPGDIIFLDKSGDGIVDVTAVITAVEETTLKAVEGDVDNVVAEVVYDLGSEMIAGYGVTIPKEQQLMLAASPDRMTERAPGNYTVWFDGTLGGLMGFEGSKNQKNTVPAGSTITLPTEWQSPEKYSYKLRGWYDVTYSRYYAPGESIKVEGNMVLYADWVAESYDIGEYNTSVADTVSTNKFITTHMFDYNSLFNVMSEKATVTVNDSSHSETWNMVTGNGTVPYKNATTLDFIFADWDSSKKLSRPNNINDKNNYNENNETKGIYNSALGTILFNTDNAWDPVTKTGIIGKTYLGTGDHLFQQITDPNDKRYGYYYYDSTLNAAAYNQSDGRFYVYDYLERTSDSASANDDWKYSDFLPLNSPYKNTNGNVLNTYSYIGKKQEYDGVHHYQYDGRYNTEGSVPANIGTNYAFGMSIDIEFYLPNDPGSEGGNKDIYGNEMNFEFSGDDDIWIFVDGNLVLDIGDIHGVKYGGINFSTGYVTNTDGSRTELQGIKAGEHTLTVYYLERGSSQSNCAIYFNLAPRFALEITKEDVYSQKLLDGAQFEVYTNPACSIPASLWRSEQEYEEKNGKYPTNVFLFEDGVASLWGFGAGNKYYLKETSPPTEVVGDPNNDDTYLLPKGIICIEFDKTGLASSKVSILEENGEISDGFTVHDFNIDEAKHQASMKITNAPEWMEETTSVQVVKIWNDSKDHSKDQVTAYLTVTDPDGTVRRIREIVLSEENNWSYVWTSLPKYEEDGTTPIEYGTVESFTSGYYSEVAALTENTNVNANTKESWSDVSGFEHNKTYLLKSNGNCLATVSKNSDKLCWVNETVAKNSELARWKAVVDDSGVRLTNEAGQTLQYINWYNWHYFNVSSEANEYQNFKVRQMGSGIQLYQNVNGKDYYIGALNGDGWLSMQELSWGGMLTFTPVVKNSADTVDKIGDIAYSITNTPLDTTTALKVTKKWDHPTDNEALYKQAQVTMKLFADEVDTGRTVTLNLKNNWTATFQGLPYTDNDGNVIKYTVKESWKTDDWIAVYGSVNVVDGSVPTYETTVTNAYRWQDDIIMPATGGLGYRILLLCGLVLVLTPFIYLIRLRKKGK